MVGDESIGEGDAGGDGEDRRDGCRLLSRVV